MMQSFKWQTLSVDRRYVADSPLGVLLSIERATTDKPFTLYVGPVSVRLTAATAAQAKRKAERVYCDLIRNEYRRVCK